MSRLVPVVENVPIARDTYRLRLSDRAMAWAIRPGQFLMIRPDLEGSCDSLLGRPLALYDVVNDPSGTPMAIDVVYVVLGRGTAALARRRPGDRLSVWWPLGNGFGPPPAGPVLLIAGGISHTPFLVLGRWWLGQASYGDDGAIQAMSDGVAAGALAERRTTPASVTLLYGVQTAARLSCVDDFRRAGIDVEVATDDGTAGHNGPMTDLVSRRLERGERPAKIVGCGPPAMLSALGRLVAMHGLPCDVSLENHMACGFGACFSCVAPIRQSDGLTDLRRVCVEGPVFPAERVDWSFDAGH
jgi:dihydroorotate dehydrogenase electron transfer subunit